MLNYSTKMCQKCPENFACDGTTIIMCGTDTLDGNLTTTFKCKDNKIGCRAREGSGLTFYVQVDPLALPNSIDKYKCKICPIGFFCDGFLEI